MRITNIKSLKMYRRWLRKNATPAEKALWKYLRNRNLENRKFRRQHSIGKYILDFYCPSEKLGIEIDSEIYDFKQKYDINREKENYLKSFNIRIIRFEDRSVFEDPKNILNKIKELFQSSNP